MRIGQFAYEEVDLWLTDGAVAVAHVVSLWLLHRDGISMMSYSVSQEIVDMWTTQQCPTTQTEQTLVIMSSVRQCSGFLRAHQSPWIGQLHAVCRLRHLTRSVLKR